MFSTIDMNPIATCARNASSLRLVLRSSLSRILETVSSGRSNAKTYAKYMELYHADESRLKDMGLTRMDVIRHLETKCPAGQRIEPLAYLASRPASAAVDSQWDLSPLAQLGRGLVSFK